eukprot:1148604-Pelagomonas_calceolata.AAC.5
MVEAEQLFEWHGRLSPMLKVCVDGWVFQEQGARRVLNYRTQQKSAKCFVEAMLGEANKQNGPLFGKVSKMFSQGEARGGY